MKMITFLLASSLVVLIKAQTDCDFDYVCNDQNALEDLSPTASTAYACYEACRDSVAVGTGLPNCDFWTFYTTLGIKSVDGEIGTLGSSDEKTKAAGTTICRRLPDCDTTFDKADCGSTVGGASCASGPGSCRPCDKCEKLNYMSGAIKAHWTCDQDMPYLQESMPPGTMCRAECPNWAAIAEVGKWSAPIAIATCESACATDDTLPNGNWVLKDTVDIFDGVPNIVTPTVDSDCLCENIVLGPHQLPNDIGATNEKGARFYCKADLIADADNTLNTMDSTSRCQLFCNNHLAMDIRCVAGSWTDEVTSSDDVYCWGPPLACDYNPGVNMDVCTCSDGLANPVTENICGKDQGCNLGNCLDVCVESETAVADADCFCESRTGGATCAVGSVCNNWECV